MKATEIAMQWLWQLEKGNTITYKGYLVDDVIISSKNIQVMTNGGLFVVTHFTELQNDFSIPVDLVKVYTDTKEMVGNFSVPCTIKKHYVKPEITVENIDTVTAIHKYSHQGKVLVLNMASSVKKGGGVENGKVAQEEDLFRCSNLCQIPDKLYPLGRLEHIYSENVSFFKDVNYKLTVVNSFADVITIAAPNLNPDIKGEYVYYIDEFYSHILNSKIDTIIKEAITNKIDILIVGAWGCGVFENNPHEIARTFKKHLQYKSIKKVVFAIKDSETSNNYIVFEEYFKEA